MPDVPSAPLRPPDVTTLTVKRSVARAGLDADEYSGHSMRAGLVTAAAVAGVQEWRIAKHSRHESLPTLRGYIRTAAVFADNVCASVL